MRDQDQDRQADPHQVEAGPYAPIFVEDSTECFHLLHPDVCRLGRAELQLHYGEPPAN
jgi:hypothetical protein